MLKSIQNKNDLFGVSRSFPTCIWVELIDHLSFSCTSLAKSMMAPSNFSIILWLEWGVSNYSSHTEIQERSSSNHCCCGWSKQWFENIALDLPAKRIFYTTSGMPDTVKRIMSAKFDGTDKFRHYTIPTKNQQKPAIQIFENGIIITDSTKNSPVYHSKKVNTFY